jgi:hypothetical protein
MLETALNTPELYRLVQKSILQEIKMHQKRNDPIIYSLSRGYGHAKYEIVGGADEWKTVKDARKIYPRIDEGKWKYNYHCPCLLLAVKRLGGWRTPSEIGDPAEILLYKFFITLNQEKTTTCLHCGQQVAFPSSEEKGYGENYYCPYCEAIYFVDFPEDSVESLMDLQDTYKIHPEQMDIKIQADFDEMIDGNDSDSIFKFPLYLYSIKIKGKKEELSDEKE